MKFGRKAHDPARLAESPRHRFAARLAAPSVDRRSVDYQPELYGNDRYGDCTVVSMANYARGVAALVGYPLVVEELSLIQFFCDVGQNADASAIDGLVAQDVIDHQGAHGLQIGMTTPLVARSGTVDLNANALKLAIQNLGGVYMGVRLYERDMDTVGKTWDVVGDSGALVGRHMINLWDYTPTAARLGTWGGFQGATWPWILNRADEAHGLVWRQLARASDGLFFGGVGADGLISQLQP